MPMYIFFDIYGSFARGVAPTDNKAKALEIGRRFMLEVYDAWDEVTIYDPRGGAEDAHN